MCDEEARQVPQVQASLLVHREVGPTLIKLNTDRLAGAVTLTPALCLAPTHLFEKDHSILGEAKLLKKLWLVSEAKGHVQGIPGQGQEGCHILFL